MRHSQHVCAQHAIRLARLGIQMCKFGHTTSGCLKYGGTLPTESELSSVYLAPRMLKSFAILHTLGIFSMSISSCDPESELTILQCQLHDVRQLLSAQKGKQRAGTPTDCELALQQYADELDSQIVFLTDVFFARSLNNALENDDAILRAELELEAQAARDHTLALALHDEPDDSMFPQEECQSQDGIDDERSSKREALMREVQCGSCLAAKYCVALPVRRTKPMNRQPHQQRLSNTISAGTTIVRCALRLSF